MSDGQALLCLSRMVELHTDGLFLHGNSLDRLQQRIGLVETLVQYHDPVLAAHLAGCGLSGPLYCSRWLITLFADVLPLRWTAALWDALFTLGRGVLPCFAAAIVLAHRERILGTATQTNLLLFFSQLNSSAAEEDEEDDEQQQLLLHGGAGSSTDAPRIDVPACLARALFLYHRTPGALLRQWDSDLLLADGLAVARRRTTSGADTKSLPPLVEPPVVLERPLELTAKRLAELVAQTEAAKAKAAAGPTAAGHGPDEPEPPMGVLLLDVRDFSLEDHCCGDDGAPPPDVPQGCVRLRLPWVALRGHVAFCRELAAVQQEMRPPPALRPHVGKAHIVVHAGVEARARGVARMLILSRVPFVSIHLPAHLVAAAGEGERRGRGAS